MRHKFKTIVNKFIRQWILIKFLCFPSLKYFYHSQKISFKISKSIFLYSKNLIFHYHNKNIFHIFYQSSMDHHIIFCIRGKSIEEMKAYMGPKVKFHVWKLLVFFCMMCGLNWWGKSPRSWVNNIIKNQKNIYIIITSCETLLKHNFLWLTVDGAFRSPQFP